ncbi:MAG: hypothetical protein DRN71_01220 [Candidatus Nanohalarchaeota archaeon]|nr:MAG: hypothetical protein DRN71_01220 [Candidatus Nanohaloarchaeota archaeon]
MPEGPFMNLKMTILYFLIAGVLFSSGCTEELTTNEIQSRLIQANSGMSSYTINMEMNTNMITGVSGEPVVIKYDITTNGDIDRANKEMALKGTVKSEIAGMTPQMNTETYLVDGYLYTKNQDAWIKMEFEDDTWARQDKIGELTELIDSGSIERMDEESFGGNSYYVIKINPDLRKVAEDALKQQSQSMPVSQSINIEDIVKEYSSTIWLNKKTFVIEKSRTEIKIVVADEDMDTTATKSMEITSVIELSISNINEPVNIVLPPEAQDAIDLADMGKAAISAFS